LCVSLKLWWKGSLTGMSYPLGLKGIVVGQGDTYEDALSDVKSAIQFHIETFGEEVIESEPPQAWQESC